MDKKAAPTSTPQLDAEEETLKMLADLFIASSTAQTKFLDIVLRDIETRQNKLDQGMKERIVEMLSKHTIEIVKEMSALVKSQ